MALIAVVGALVFVTRSNAPLHRNVRVVPLGAAVLTVDDTRFVTLSAEASVATPVTVMVDNQGTRSHRITIGAPVTAVQAITAQVLDPLDTGAAGQLAVEVPPQTEAVVTFTPTAKGTFPITCDVPSSDGMAASLLID